MEDCSVIPGSSSSTADHRESFGSDNRWESSSFEPFSNMSYSTTSEASFDFDFDNSWESDSSEASKMSYGTTSDASSTSTSPSPSIPVASFPACSPAPASDLSDSIHTSKPPAASITAGPTSSLAEVTAEAPSGKSNNQPRPKKKTAGTVQIIINGWAQYPVVDRIYGEIMLTCTDLETVLRDGFPGLYWDHIRAVAPVYSVTEKDRACWKPVLEHSKAISTRHFQYTRQWSLYPSKKSTHNSSTIEEEDGVWTKVLVTLYGHHPGSLGHVALWEWLETAAVGKVFWYCRGWRR
ncbi:hypothetical protein QBC35DRAFT_542108 [Podospora australis]|uniref:Uncharacterized protein n=1 Tax=Podospora australis TaxID=1536484 RepID=A0AAN7AFD3_9PEZI|nr:hypothetical protein QBC35DRAFT_542108 [Podospora australis]